MPTHPAGEWTETAALRPTLRERWSGLRDRLLGDPRFQRWAAAFPLTRRIAARRAGALFDLCAGFVYSQVLLACVRLDLFELLARRSRTAAEIAQRTQLPGEAAQRLLDAAVALGLLERRRGGLYGLGQLGAALRGNPGVAAMIEHHDLLYADLADPVAMLRSEAGGRRLADYWPYAGAEDPRALEPERVRAYTTLMSASQPLVAEDVLDAYPFQRHRRLLDVGGGDGSFLAAVARRAPMLELQLFDLPGVVEHARARLAGRGLAGRVACSAGSFLHDPLPRGADVISLIRVLHDHDDGAALRLLAAAREALGEHGTIVIGEPLAGTRGAESMGDAYFGLYLQAMGSGRPRTAGQIAAMLRSTGFTDVRQLRTARPLLVGALTARVPSPPGNVKIA